MLQPIRTKFRKAFKGRIHGVATSGATLAFGQYGLKALEPERVTARQIEAARRALTRFMKRSGRVWIRVFPGRAGVEEADRSPHGQRQGHAGSLGGAASSRAASCSRSTAFRSPSPRKRWRSPPPSCRSRPVSSNASPSDAMKAADVRAMTLDQLDDEVLKLKKEQFNLRFQRATGQLENTSRVRVDPPRHRAHENDRRAEARRRARAGSEG